MTTTTTPTLNPPHQATYDAIAPLLEAAVEAVGGTPRPGQLAMAVAVAHAIDQHDHLLVQAGTGTGKSLAYLVPALWLRRRVVISTATLALQRQLIVHDLPRVVAALTPLLGREPSYALLKGRNNYVCMHRVADGPPDDEVLFDATATSPLGRDVVRVREWAQDTGTGDRDDLSPGVSDRVWGQVSVSARECLGASKCPHADDCFAELAREQARLADIVVTNHALLAIDTFDSELHVLPEHNAVIIDEAHELVSRATSAATVELTPASVNRAVRRAARLADERDVDALAAAGDAFNEAVAMTPSGRLVALPEQLGQSLAQLRDASRTVISALSGKGRDRSSGEDEALRKQALAALDAVFEVTERALGGGDQEGERESDEAPKVSANEVLWLEKNDRIGAALRVAPLSIAARLRDRLLARTPTVFTSATLKLGGDFTGMARSLGLRPAEQRVDQEPDDAGTDDQPSAGGESDAMPWRGLDVGSPFDYRKQGILYVARHLPPPGRDGLREDQIEEMVGLVTAAGGRTLGLFSSMRAAEAASAAVRERIEHPVLCQGEDSLAELLRIFSEEPRTCLFGTLSLWQGVNVPGPSCQLVIIDRVPFPRPDDPLLTARQEAVAASGGNGFMAVAASHAALLLAQGAGRLIRSMGDRGVVAVLDSRLETARYGGFLRASLPPFWPTTDREQVRRSLKAIDAAAG